jgi:single-strand selective monofunctional uracil DNA glycosylase
MSAGKALITAARKLSDQVDALSFAAPVATVYNPLVYARTLHEQYLTRFANVGIDALFLGMNPGPFGMAQTGVPFGEIAAVRDWMGLSGDVKQPPQVHPKRPIDGLACTKSEVSGRRLWGCFAERFPKPESFFKRHFVANYCPLVFMSATGSNITPDKLPSKERDPLEAACDAHLVAVVAALKPKRVIGVGAFAMKRAQLALTAVGNTTPVATILHPSPASPAANRGWAEQATKQLIALGVWP